MNARFAIKKQEEKHFDLCDLKLDTAHQAAVHLGNRPLCAFDLNKADNYQIFFIDSQFCIGRVMEFEPHLVICDETTVFLHFHRDVDNLAIPLQYITLSSELLIDLTGLTVGRLS